MGWAVKDVAHAFFVLYLTTSYPGQVTAYMVFAIAVTVAGSLLLKSTLVPVDFRDDWYEYEQPDDDPEPGTPNGPAASFAPAPRLPAPASPPVSGLPDSAVAVPAAAMYRASANGAAAATLS